MTTLLIIRNDNTKTFSLISKSSDNVKNHTKIILDAIKGRVQEYEYSGEGLEGIKIVSGLDGFEYKHFDIDFSQNICQFTRIYDLCQYAQFNFTNSWSK